MKNVLKVGTLKEQMNARRAERIPECAYEGREVDAERTGLLSEWLNGDGPRASGRLSGIPLVEPDKWKRHINWPEYRHTNYLGYHRQYNAKRKAAVLKRTPPWADPDEIEAIYLGCPEDHHVDHIVPLQGTTVSGLHVTENLQYLPVSENIRKGNRWEDH